MLELFKQLFETHDDGGSYHRNICLRKIYDVSNKSSRNCFFNKDILPQPLI